MTLLPLIILSFNIQSDRLTHRRMFTVHTLLVNILRAITEHSAGYYRSRI